MWVCKRANVSNGDGRRVEGVEGRAQLRGREMGVTHVTVVLVAIRRSKPPGNTGHRRSPHVSSLKFVVNFCKGSQCIVRGPTLQCPKSYATHANYHESMKSEARA